MSALYLDVKKDLLDKITSGEYSEGTIIPTEHELSDLYNVSRPTIRKAVRDFDSYRASDLKKR